MATFLAIVEPVPGRRATELRPDAQRVAAAFAAAGGPSAAADVLEELAPPVTSAERSAAGALVASA